MFQPLSLFVGLRYTRAKRRNQFISFVSLISLLGMVLGVMALIIVLSVMNGFEAELRGRVLSLVPHGFVSGEQQQLADWDRWQDSIVNLDGVVAAAPYVGGHSLLSRPGLVRGSQLYAISPEHETRVSSIHQHMRSGTLHDLQAGEFRIIIGSILARYLGVYPGDELSVVLPKVTITPLGVFPRVKRFTVSGIFEVGAELDGNTAFIHLEDGQKLFQLGEAVHGLRLQFDDLLLADSYLAGVLATMPDGSEGKSWAQTQGSLFKAVAMEKTMIGLLLMIIVFIAAFNIVSILSMMVADKRSDIAVLRTMGASPGTIQSVFMIQGTAVGLAGIVIGLVLGIPLAINAGDIVNWFEGLLGQQVFNPDVYFISRIPSVLEWPDVAMVAFCGLLFSILATLYPAARAATIHPAEALRYE